MSDDEKSYNSLEEMARHEAEIIWKMANQSGEMPLSDKPISVPVQQIPDLLERLSQYPVFEVATLGQDMRMNFERDMTFHNPYWHKYHAKMAVDSPFSLLELKVNLEKSIRNEIILTVKPEASPITYEELARKFGFGVIRWVTHIDHFHEDGSCSWSPGWITYEYGVLNGKRVNLTFPMGGKMILESVLLENMLSDIKH